MIDNSTGWYFMINQGRDLGLIRGPFSNIQMREFLKTGEVTENTQIRYGTNSLWRPLRDVPIFAKSARGSKANEIGSGFLKNYSVFIVVVVLIVLVFFYARMQTPRHLVKSSNVVEAPLASHNFRVYPISRELLNREDIITLTNNARALNALPPLRANPLLNAIAEARAKDMLEKQYFAHVSPTGQQASDIAQSIGYRYKIIAENIGSGNFLTNQKIVDGWMQSPGHRRNILTREVEEIGAEVLKGWMNGAETYIAVQIFGLQSPPVPQYKYTACVAPSQNLLDDIELRKAEIEGLNNQLRRIKEELDEEKESIETDRRYTYGDPQKIDSLNVKVRAHNDKSRWHNQILMDAKAKSIVLKSMINEYNRASQAYNDCRTSK
jgi:uncharacterized protein YkwD